MNPVGTAQSDKSAFYVHFTSSAQLWLAAFYKQVGPPDT